MCMAIPAHKHARALREYTCTSLSIDNIYIILRSIYIYTYVHASFSRPLFSMSLCVSLSLSVFSNVFSNISETSKVGHNQTCCLCCYSGGGGGCGQHNASNASCGGACGSCANGGGANCNSGDMKGEGALIVLIVIVVILALIGTFFLVYLCTKPLSHQHLITSRYAGGGREGDPGGVAAPLSVSYRWVAVHTISVSPLGSRQRAACLIYLC